MRPMVLIGGALSILLAATGCEREEEPAICPQLGVGDLVISEIAQKGDDSAWLELYNAGAGSAELLGLEIRMIDPTDHVQTIRVRRDVTVGPGERVVLWGKTEDERPAYADYAWYPDLADDSPLGNPRSLYRDATIELRSCDLRIDAVTYTGLPSSGTWSLGVEPPTELANDDQAAWCNVAPAGNDLPYGSPGEANPPCP